MRIKRKIKEQIELDPSSVSIDKTSLLSFIKENLFLKAVEQRVIEDGIINKISDDPEYIASSAIPLLRQLEINTIKQLEDLYTEHNSELIEYVKKLTSNYEKANIKSFVAGASILWLSSILEELKSK